MIAKVTADGRRERDLLEQIAQRGRQVQDGVEQTVRAILSDVHARGDEAVRFYTEKFDGCSLPALEIAPAEMKKALECADPAFVQALRKAKENIAAFHQQQKPRSFVDARENGVLMGQQVRGLDRVGVYVPGGTAAYPSSVLMNVIPARIAGVREVLMLTPPAKDGKANPDILTAAAIAGVDRVFLAGGAQGIAAAAYGTQSIPRVDKLVGPGNVYVATAKRLLYGTVDIDMVAGPSEILILADRSANPAWLAADLMSQAEHDPLASAILLTNDEQIAERTLEELCRQVEGLSRGETIRRALRDYGAIVVCADVSQMLALANEVAPEHLEVALENPWDYIGSIRNAGSVFLGAYSPEPLGDYFAGPNHVLPTGGTARFFSPLGVESFVKRSSFLYYTRGELEKARDDIVRIAEKEGLTAHANAVSVRFDVDPGADF